MDLIDEKGNLFGVVNVIDALVVLVVLAMVVAGAALVVSGGGGEEQPPDEPEPTRYATVSYAAPLGSEAATLSPGETLAASGDEAYDVADTYRSFTPNGRAHVVATLGYNGSLTAGGSTVYGGESVSLRTDGYRVNADVLAVNGTEETIPTTTRRVVLAVNESATVSRAVDSGMEARIGDDLVGTVTAVEGSGTENARVGAELVVWERGPVPTFDGEGLRAGNRVTLVTDTVVIRTRIVAVGTDDIGAVSDG